MPITKKPLFDCLSCDAFVPDRRPGRSNYGWCRRFPPTAQIVGQDELSKMPIVMSNFPPVEKNMYCLQHPMAKAFPPAEFSAKPMGEAEPIGGNAAAHRELDGVVQQPAAGAFELIEDETPIPGEAKPKPEVAN